MVLDVGFRSILALEEFAPSQDYTAHQLFRTRKGPNLMTRFEQKASSNVRKVSMHPFTIYIQISSAAVIVSAVKEVIVRAPSIHLSPCLAWLSRRISNSWRMEDTSASQAVLSYVTDMLSWLPDVPAPDPSATNGRMSCSLASSHPLQGPFHARENKQIQAANTANMTINNTCANCKVEHHSLPCAISGIPNFGPCTCGICWV